MQTSRYKLFPDSVPGAICISRGMPRGTKYPRYWNLAPGMWFDSVSKEDYIRLFESEILAPLDPQQVWTDLHLIAQNHAIGLGMSEEEARSVKPTLLCFEQIPAKNALLPASELPWKQFCHRRLVAEWFERELSFPVPEYVKPKAGKVKDVPVESPKAVVVPLSGDQITLF